MSLLETPFQIEKLMSFAAVESSLPLHLPLVYAVRVAATLTHWTTNKPIHHCYPAPKVRIGWGKLMAYDIDTNTLLTRIVCFTILTL